MEIKYMNNTEIDRITQVIWVILTHMNCIHCSLLYTSVYRTRGELKWWVFCVHLSVLEFQDIIFPQSTVLSGFSLRLFLPCHRTHPRHLTFSCALPLLTISVTRPNNIPFQDEFIDVFSFTKLNTIRPKDS